MPGKRDKYQWCTVLFFLLLLDASSEIGSVTPDVIVLDANGNQKELDEVAIVFNSYVTLICRTVSNEHSLNWMYASSQNEAFTPLNETAHITISSQKNEEVSLQLINVRFHMSGVYQCTNGLASRQISVHVYGVLNKISSTVHLVKKHEVVGSYHLQINALNSSSRPVVACAFRVGSNGVKYTTVRWKGGKYHSKPNLYEVAESRDEESGIIWSNLTLLHPSYDQELYGKYYCMFNVVPGTMETAEVEISIPPLIRKYERSANPYSGVKFTYLCDIFAYPPVTEPITWVRNEVPISIQPNGQAYIQDYDTENRIHFETRNISNDQIVFDTIQPDDRAVYSCFVHGVLGNDTAAFYLRVKDRRAPLWPLIGIVLELVILFAVILVYELKRRERAKQEEASIDLITSSKTPNAMYGVEEANEDL
ncbi:unnamed protein product [Heterobilharzia americana]|nr:unnamed protein product [Heterobilharzia americana]CAH8580592.1 unnamed protein product [Heterobilharzia americana]